MADPTVIEIPLRAGLVALVEACDAHLAAYRWVAEPRDHTTYAVRRPFVNGQRRKVSLHRVILGVLDRSVLVDHINGNGLDCRRGNLRIVSPRENMWNMRRRRDNTSGFKGVSWCENNKGWIAAIQLDRKRTYLGTYSDPSEAARVYDRAAVRLFGAYAKLNFPEAA